MILYITRHGYTSWNLQKRVQGRVDIPLAQEGKDLARITGEALKDVHFDLAISSPLKRAYETAQIMLNNENIPILTDWRIAEIDFGNVEGTHFRDENGKICSKEMELFFDEPLNFIRPVGGENLADVIRRTKYFWEDLINNKELQDKTILISSHGCASRGIMQNVFKDYKNYWHGGVPKNCSVSIVEVNNKVPKLIQLDKSYN